MSLSSILIVSVAVSIVDIDDCESSPCKNGGRCVDGLDVFTCQCSSGHTGNQCETSESFFAYNCTSFYLVVSSLLQISTNVHRFLATTAERALMELTILAVSAWRATPVSNAKRVRTFLVASDYNMSLHTFI